MTGMTRGPLRELQENGFCVLRQQFSRASVETCRQAFWPLLLAYLDAQREAPNRGPHRHFLPMPFNPPCFAPEFFFDKDVLSIVRGAMDDRVVADQWGCDMPLRGSEFQAAHVDYRRPLFAERPELELPPYMLVLSFGLVPVTLADGPLEIAPGTHRMAREQASEISLRPVPLDLGDVLIRHPWALHRGSPNITDTPRALVSIRYVRRWYADESREVQPIPRTVWEALTPEQRSVMRFPLE
jgi:hypothetical protein